MKCCDMIFVVSCCLGSGRGLADGGEERIGEEGSGDAARFL